MVSFKHPNVMSLVMPYMSKGSVLEYVKQNKCELLFDREVNEEVSM